MNNEIKINADIVIVGGGIAGLWTLNYLNNLGYNTILLENNKLGSGQTLKSQGIIHGGLKYALNGVLSNETEEIAKMPSVWKEALSGIGDVDLSQAKVLSNTQHLFYNNNLISKLSGFFASKLVNARISKLSENMLPEIFKTKTFKGSVYSLDEIVLDTKSVITKLAANYQDKIIKIDREDLILIKKENGLVDLAKVKINSAYYEISAKAFVFTAGENNYRLSSKHIARDMQLRPLHMVYLKGKNLKPLYAHLVGSAIQPILTITTHVSKDNLPVWYLGGKIAEEGINRDSNTQIIQAKNEIAKIFPWLDFKGTVWDSFFVNRAEAKTDNGKKPESVSAFLNKNIITAWPTKLALAPKLALEIHSLIKTMNIKVNNNAKIQYNFPQPEIASYPWDE